MNTQHTKPAPEKTAQHWSDTPEGRRKHYSENPQPRKKGRPYKNPNLVPQGVTEHIRALTTELERVKADRDELLAALKQTKAELCAGASFQRIVDLLRAAIANAETK